MNDAGVEECYSIVLRSTGTQLLVLLTRTTGSIIWWDFRHSYAVPPHGWATLPYAGRHHQPNSDVIIWYDVYDLTRFMTHQVLWRLWYDVFLHIRCYVDDSEPHVRRMALLIHVNSLLDYRLLMDWNSWKPDRTLRRSLHPTRLGGCRVVWSVLCYDVLHRASGACRWTRITCTSHGCGYWHLIAY